MHRASFIHLDRPNSPIALFRPHRQGLHDRCRPARPLAVTSGGGGGSRWSGVTAAADALRRSHPGTAAKLEDTTLASLALWACTELPALAAPDALPGAPPPESYWVPLGLFAITLPGLWSLIKRAPKAKLKRKTFEVAGPGVEGAVPLDSRARQIFGYFRNYNYSVKSKGEVIIFEGNFRGSVGQAAALVLYTVVGLASTALVLSIAVPFGGNWWYALCALSPAAGAYYLKNAERTEEFKVKMVTSDDNQTTDIIVEGDDEEIDRFRRELGLNEKGMILVKGLLEQ